MSDRELIELAAKAAEIELDASAGFPDAVYRIYPHSPGMLQQWRVWNPLQNDGDALRLAVKFCFSLEQWQHSVEVKIGDDVIHRELASGKVTRIELTRRAIVRAAAEIQRAKEAACN